jgi:probable non-F420 flavinoid oxidoreductase
MTVLGFHASHEQVHPSELIAAAQLAEQVGFTAAMCSDHFSPWSERQGQSAFAWSWLGAALQATSLPFGVVNAPGQRYHPAIIAQAVATLSAMYPGRFWAALGTGEASNEHITGQVWPRKEVRNARLGECVDVMRRLLAGEEVSHDGLVTVDRARVWTRPEVPPALLAAAVSPKTAAWAAGWADGLATVLQPHADLTRTVEAYRGAGGRGPLALQVHLSYAADDETALTIAHEQWRSNVFSPTRPPSTSLARRCRARCSSPATPASTCGGCRTWWRSASTRSTCTTSARSRPSGSRSSARRCCLSST